MATSIGILAAIMAAEIASAEDPNDGSNVERQFRISKCDLNIPIRNGAAEQRREPLQVMDPLPCQSRVSRAFGR